MKYSYDKFLKALGPKLRDMRIARGFTLRDMMVKHGFSLSQWQKLEKGGGVSVPTLLRLCQIFDVTLNCSTASNLRNHPQPLWSNAY